MQKILFNRLATTIVVDDENYLQTPESIRVKLLTSLLLSSKDNKMISTELKKICEQEYNILITLPDIDKLLQENSNFIKNYMNDKVEYSLTPEFLSVFKSRASEKTIDHFINDFFSNSNNLFSEYLISLPEFKEIIHRFLYHIMNNSLIDFQKIADNTLTLEPESNIGKIFKGNEQKVINDFLNWDNSLKNELIYKLSNIGLEYCILSNSNNFDVFSEIGIKNKHFHLDTNIIFRVLGLNGKIRKERSITFFKRCIETNQSILVSKFTQKEFFDSISYHCKKISTYKNSNVNLFCDYSTEDDFYDYYYTWKHNHLNSGIDLFHAHINGLFNKFIDDFKVRVIYEIPFNEEAEVIKNKINDYSLSIEKHKNDFSSSSSYFSHHNSIVDAKNIYLIEQSRNKKDISFSETQDFMISTDHRLLNWDHSRKDILPIVMLPSHWLSLTLRFISRTSDDFKSFVSYINIPQHKELLSNEQLHVILAGISEIVEDKESQEIVLRNIFERKFLNILNSKKTENIYTRTLKQTEKIYSANLSKSIEKNKNLGNKIELLQTKTKKLENSNLQLKKELSTQPIIKKETTPKINIFKNKYEELKEEIKKKDENQKLKKWRKWGWLSLFIGILILSSFLLIFFFKDKNWNFMSIIISFIDMNDSGTIRNLLYAIIITFYVTLFPLSIHLFYKRIFSDTHKKKYLKSL